MPRLLLEALREKLTGLGRRLRLLVLRFARRAAREPTGPGSAAAGAATGLMEPAPTAPEASEAAVGEAPTADVEPVPTTGDVQQPAAAVGPEAAEALVSAPPAHGDERVRLAESAPDEQAAAETEASAAGVSSVEGAPSPAELHILEVPPPSAAVVGEAAARASASALEAAVAIAISDGSHPEEAEAVKPTARDKGVPARVGAGGVGEPLARLSDADGVPPAALQVEPDEQGTETPEVEAVVATRTEEASPRPEPGGMAAPAVASDSEAFSTSQEDADQPRLSGLDDAASGAAALPTVEARQDAARLSTSLVASLRTLPGEPGGPPEPLPAPPPSDAADHAADGEAAAAVGGEEADSSAVLKDEGAALAQPPVIDEAVVERTADAQRAVPKERRRPRVDPEEMARPAVISAPELEDDEYRLWNRAVAQHCLLGDDGVDAVYLTVTPTILAAAFNRVRAEHLLPEEAQAALVRAVAAVYHGRVLGHRERLRVLRRCGSDGLPDCIAFLAASVLAAYEMRSDEEAAGTAYYKRLADLLRCDFAGGHPHGFDPDEFEALWRFLEAWLRIEKGRQLAFPGAEVGLRRFVALPLMHVPLRRVDMERLPAFFWWAGYEPRARIPRTTLDLDLASWCLGVARFTDAGMAALADERRGAVVAQVAHELESWDGEQRDSPGRRSVRVEVLLDFVRRSPQLSYLPRRPAAFPAVFDDGARRLEAAEDGWYDPLPIRGDDGPALLEGFEWEAAADGLRFALLRPPARAIALPESPEYSWFVSHKALRLGVRAGVLCAEALAGMAAEYLGAISGERCTPLVLPGLPTGWCLFVNVRPHVRTKRPPPELATLDVEAVVDLIPRDGLRLGARWAWLAGAPPRLTVAGLETGERVTLDGVPVNVAEDGSLATNARLLCSGTHVIEAAGMRRRIEIVEPQVPQSLPRPASSVTALALPRGAWTILGAVPGELSVPAARSYAGTVAWCGFRPVWAVEVGAGPGARVLCLCAAPPPPARPARFAVGSLSDGALRWADKVYNAFIRRPALQAADGRPCGPAVRARWDEYRHAAREIKRAFRRGRR